MDRNDRISIAGIGIIVIMMVGGIFFLAVGDGSQYDYRQDYQHKYEQFGQQVYDVISPLFGAVNIVDIPNFTDGLNIVYQFVDWYTYMTPEDIRNDPVVEEYVANANNVTLLSWSKYCPYWVYNTEYTLRPYGWYILDHYPAFAYLCGNTWEALMFSPRDHLP